MRRRKYMEGYAFIYVLTDLFDNVFYVGCTIQPIEKRLQVHIIESRASRPNTNKAKIEKIRSLDYNVKIKEIARVWVKGYKGYEMNAGGRKLEREWMLKYHRMGCDLTNGKELALAIKYDSRSRKG